MTGILQYTLDLGSVVTTDRHGHLTLVYVTNSLDLEGFPTVLLLTYTIPSESLDLI